MQQPFIRNHQFNLINKQVNLLHRTISTVTDPKVVESVRYSVHSKIMELFPDAAKDQKQTLEKISTLNTWEEFQYFLRSLEPLMEEFAPVSEKQIRKLFPKNKKLKVPHLGLVDYRYITYLGWTDIATNKMFLVYHLNGQLVGVEGRFTPLNAKSPCFLCNRHEEVAFFSAITKSKPLKASPDYYKAIGNYMCVDSEICNKNITDVTALEKFIQQVIG